MLHKGIRSQNFVWYFGLAITFAVSVVGCGVSTGFFSADSLAAFNSSNFGYRGAGVALGVVFAGAFAGTLAGVLLGSSESIGLLFYSSTYLFDIFKPVFRSRTYQRQSSFWNKHLIFSLLS